jgi:NitT/TauT family transport system substrate-binding protein
MHQPALSALILAFLANAHAVAADAPLKVGITPWIGDISAAVAVEEGLWRKLGLQVELINYQSDEDFRAAISGGAIDLCYDMTAMSISMIADGADLTIYAETQWSHGGDKIILAKGQTAKALPGTPVGLYDEGPAVNLVLDAWLRREGVDPDKVERLTLESGLLTDSFNAGKLKAILNYDPQAGRAVKEGGGVVAATTADFPGIMPEGIAGKRGLHQVRLQAFFTGLIQGSVFAKDPAHLAAVTAAANKHLFPNDPQTPEAIAEQIGSVRLHGPAEILERNVGDTGLKTFVEQVQAWSVAHGRSKADMDGRYDPSAAVSAAKVLIGK